MNSGNSTTAIVLACERWNDTKIRLVAGRRYCLIATGTWKDASIECDADGYQSPNALLRAAESVRRVPDQPWFTLIGCIERDSATFFRIGRKLVISPTTSGTLFCFANDVSFMYWNNSGSLELIVTQIAA